jgi:ribose transport system substrate-binding protein
MATMGLAAITFASMLTVVGSGVATSSGAAVAACTTAAPCKAYFSINFTGNAFRNQVLKETGLATTVGDAAGKVTLKLADAGTTVEAQAQSIENIVASKNAQILVVLSSSSTGLNTAIKDACNAGITVVVVETPVTEPCAYTATVDYGYLAKVAGAWLGEQAHGKSGVILADAGLPGVPFEVAAIAGFKSGIKMTAPQAKIVWFNGMLNAGSTKAALASVAGKYKNNLLGVAGITAGLSQMQGISQAGITKPVPQTNMTGVNSDMAPCVKVAQKCFYGVVPAYEGAYALQEAVSIRAGKTFPAVSLIPGGFYSNTGAVKAFPAVKPVAFKNGVSVFPTYAPEFAVPFAFKPLPVTSTQVNNAAIPSN